MHKLRAKTTAANMALFGRDERNASRAATILWRFEVNLTRLMFRSVTQLP